MKSKSNSLLLYPIFEFNQPFQFKLQEHKFPFDIYNAQTFYEYPVLVDIADCLYRGGRFYNSDYHLGSEAAEEHTALLLKRLKEHLGE